MKRLKINGAALASSMIKSSFDKIDYQDCYCISVSDPHHYSVDYLAGLFFVSGPEWINTLLAFRNIIVSIFGLKGGKIDKTRQPVPSVYYPKGSRIALFKVCDRNDHEIVMGKDDKHLNLRTSVRIEKSPDTDRIKLYSFTIVHYNNIWGRLYFLPVKPFHQLIIKATLKSLLRRLE